MRYIYCVTGVFAVCGADRGAAVLPAGEVHELKPPSVRNSSIYHSVLRRTVGAQRRPLEIDQRCMCRQHNNENLDHVLI